MCGPAGGERTQANEEEKKKPKKQIVTGDKTQDTKKITQDSKKQIEQG